MKTYYKNDLKKVHMILMGNENECEDYQIDMLRENDISGVLQTETHYIDNISHYYYDISGKTSFKILHDKIHLNCEEMRELIKDLLNTVQELQKYMLDANNILLEPEYIFVDGGHYFFCYYPCCNQDIKDKFHKLTEYFVREVNYKDEEGVHFAYTLHKATMEENYSLEQILKQLMPQEEEELDIPDIDYVECMEINEEENDMVEEKNSIWEPVRRLIEKTKKRKWADREEDL